MEGDPLLPNRDLSDEARALKELVEMMARALVDSPEQVSVEADRKSTRLNSSHIQKSRMPSSA